MNKWMRKWKLSISYLSSYKEICQYEQRYLKRYFRIYVNIQKKLPSTERHNIYIIISIIYKTVKCHMLIFRLFYIYHWFIFHKQYLHKFKNQSFFLEFLIISYAASDFVHMWAINCINRGHGQNCGFETFYYLNFSEIRIQIISVDRSFRFTFKILLSLVEKHSQY